MGLGCEPTVECDDKARIARREMKPSPVGQIFKPYAYTGSTGLEFC